MKIPARSAIIGIMVLADRQLTAGQLIALAASIGLSASNVKSHLTRMVVEGTLERRGRTRFATYNVTMGEVNKIESIKARVTNHSESPWDQSWFMLATRFPPQRAIRDQLRALLWFDGFRLVGSEAFVRPAWPLPWAEERSREYAELAFGICVRGSVISSQAGFVKLYDLDGLNQEAKLLARRIRRKIASGLSPRKAFAARIRVGGEVAHLIGHDPRLPREIWGLRTGMSELVDSFRQFEQRVARQSQRFVNEITAP
jgi:DNA-binding transcriptional regulator PaaX